MATVSRIPTFQDIEEDWSSYHERLECYFAVNETDNAKKVPTLIMGLSASQYQTLKNLLAPTKPAEKEYNVIVETMKKHYGGTTNARSERAIFRKTFRKEDESVQNYSIRLKQGSRNCAFGASLDQQLVDQLIYGIRSSTIATKIMDATQGLDLTFNQAVELAVSTEMTEKSLPVVEATKSLSGSVHSVSKPKRFPQRKKTSRDSRQPTYSNNSASSSYSPSSQGVKNKRLCFRCNSPKHLANNCQYRDAVCYKCQKRGHIGPACRGGKPPSQHTVECTPAVESASVENVTPYNMYNLSAHDELNLIMNNSDMCLTKGDSKYIASVSVNGTPVDFEVDTGAVVSCVSYSTYEKLCSPGDTLIPLKVTLRDYNKKPLAVSGVAMVTVMYNGQSKQLPLVVVKGDRASLFGRNWLRHIRLDWNLLLQHQHPKVCSVNIVSSITIQQLCDKYSDLFKPELGCLKDFEVSLCVKPDAVPVYKRARSVPYQIRPLLDEELRRLEDTGVIKPIAFSDWASPIVSVIKSDGKSLRVCADFKETLNPACNMAQYPLPTPEDIFATLSKGQLYTKLDMSHAYHQLCLSEEAQKYMVINTHKGLFAYQRLQFGVHSAVGIFQRTMENVLKGIPSVAVFIDDILVSGASEEEHLRILERVLKRLQDAGLRLNKGKCNFMSSSVRYLGHKLSAQGIHPLDDKVQSIQAFPKPSNSKELATFCGMVKYYHRFLPGVSQVMAPLFELEKSTTWKWTQRQNTAFLTAKSLLMSNKLLVHYDSSKALFLTCDSSSYGLGAVLEQGVDGDLRPICYASRTLSSAEKNYCQTEKEALAIVWGISKFHKYLYGRYFEVRTDHKPVLGLLGEAKAIPVMASGRIIRWALQLAAYQYKLVYVPGTRIANADCLSRFPLNYVMAEPPAVGEEIMLVNQLQSSSCTADDIRRWTDRDPLLSKVRLHVQQGWTSVSTPELSPYYGRRNELSVMKGCVLWGTRIVVPPQGRDLMTSMLHDSHPGIVKMKSLARGYMWWPNMDIDLERCVSKCRECQSVRNLPLNNQPLHPWEFPSKPWERVHIDYAGPTDGRMFLVLVDAYSKWLEVIPTTGCTAKITITQLRRIFSTHGIPDIIVSDNATAFMGSEFQEFVMRNGIRHITGAPYHAATNGLAENAVKTFKSAMKKSTGDMEDRLFRFLFDYRITPHVTTGVPPCELLMNRKVKCRFDLLRPSIGNIVKKKQEIQARNYSCNRAGPDITVGDNVYYKNYSHIGPPNIPGTVVERTGPISCKVQNETGAVVRKHFVQLFKQHKPAERSIVSSGGESSDSVEPGMPEIASPERSVVGSAAPADVSAAGNKGDMPGKSAVSRTPSVPARELGVGARGDTVVLRRSSRVSKPVERLNYDK